MEDDDEFGDLYSDVLQPFSSTATKPSSAAPQPHHPFPSPPLLHRPIQLNRDSAPEPMVIDSKREPADAQDVKFDIEEGVSNGIEDIRSDDPIFPGLTEPVRQEESGWNNNGNDDGIRSGEAEAGEGDGCDSDSEDDLQIVLNDNHHGLTAMERGGTMGEDDDDDEDGDPLVIVADVDVNQGMEEQEWGEGGGQAADGEKKEGEEAGKVGTAGGGNVLAPKVGYSNHGYHPFHSQFKVSVLTC